jgi:hypothetical protein
VGGEPEKAPSGPVSIVLSATDQRAVVLRNGVIIGSAPVEIEGPVTGTWAYAFRNADSAGQHWIRVPLSSGSDEQEVTPTEWRRFKAPDQFRQAVAAIAERGRTVVVTADSLRSGAVASPLTLIQAEPKKK